MNPNFEEVWVYLSASPLTALTITLLAYLFGDWVYQNRKDADRKSCFDCSYFDHSGPVSHWN